MKELFNQLESRWSHLATREKRLLMVGAVFFGGLLVVMVIIKPAHDYFSDSKRDWVAAYQDLQWIEQQQTVLLESGSAGTSEGVNQSILTIANLTAREYGLKWNRSEPGEQGLLRLWLEDVAFDKLVTWISQINQRFGINVRSIQVETGTDEGLVDVRLEIIR